MSELIIYGRASQKKTAFRLSRDQIISNEDLSLMDYLHIKGIPIASSCKGEGICNKCYVFLNEQNQDILSCQLKVNQLLKNYKTCTIEVDYL